MRNPSKAFLFDLDGTLIDSMPHHHAAWHEWYTRRGWAMQPGGFFASTAGRTNAEILADMFPQLPEDERVAMANEKEAIYRGIAARSLGLIAGVAPFLAQAKASGICMAVCTASTPQNMALAFERHAIDAWVETVVSPADGLRGKPHPDIFLEAARLHRPAAPRVPLVPGGVVVRHAVDQRAVEVEQECARDRHLTRPASGWLRSVDRGRRRAPSACC